MVGIAAPTLFHERAHITTHDQHAVLTIHCTNSALVNYSLMEEFPQTLEEFAECSLAMKSPRTDGICPLGPTRWSSKAKMGDLKLSQDSLTVEYPGKDLNISLPSYVVLI